METENARYYLIKNQAKPYLVNGKVLPKMRETLGELIKRRMKDVGIKNNAELARRLGVSPSYAGDLVNDTGKTKAGYYEPSKELTAKLSEVLEIPASDILLSLGWHKIGDKRKPQTVGELIQALDDLGFDVQFDADFSDWDEDDLQDLLDDIRAKILVKAERKKRDL